MDLPLVTGRERALIRQRRFDALGRWFVPQIITSLAVPPQAAVFVFFAGLIVLLWTIHKTVAIAITSAVVVSLLAWVITAAIPIMFTDCPYKSPLALVFNVICCQVIYPIVTSTESTLRSLSNAFKVRLHVADTNLRLPQSPEYYRPGLWQSIFFAIYRQLCNVQPAVELLRQRILCCSWLEMEKRETEIMHQEGFIRQVIQVIEGTAKTSSSFSINALVPCLFEPADPRTALLQ